MPHGMIEETLGHYMWKDGQNAAPNEELFKQLLREGEETHQRKRYVPIIISEPC